MKKDKRKISIGVLIAIIGAIIILIVGITYAFLNIDFKGDKVVSIEKNGLVFSYIEGTNNIALAANHKVDDATGKSSGNYFDFTVGLKTTDNREVDYIIYIEKEPGSTLGNSAIKLYLTDQTNTIIEDVSKISELDSYSPKANSYELYSTSISSDNNIETTHYYRLRAWIDGESGSAIDLVDDDDDHYAIIGGGTYSFTVNVTTIENETNVWAKGFGGSDWDEFTSIVPTSDGGYIVAGYSKSNLSSYGITNKGNADAIIVKYDSSGNVTWAKGFGGSGFDEFTSIVPTSDGGYIVVGDSGSNLSSYGISISRPAIIVKYDSSGNVTWAKGFGGSGYDYFYSVVQTSDGGYIVVGNSESNLSSYGITNQGNNDAIIVKYDSSGNVVWAKGLGGGGNDYFYSVVQTSDGGYITVGAGGSDLSSYGIPRLSLGSSFDAIIVKYDSSGNIVWGKSFGGGDWGWDEFTSIVPTSDGGYIVAGYSYSDLSSYGISISKPAIIVKYDSSGNIIWAKGFGGSEEDNFKSAVPTSDGGYIAVGNSWSDLSSYGISISKPAIIVKYDSSGNIIWAKGFGGSDWDGFLSVGLTSDGGYITVGCSESNLSSYEITNQGDVDAIIVKYDKFGNTVGP